MSSYRVKLESEIRVLTVVLALIVLTVVVFGLLVAKRAASTISKQERSKYFSVFQLSHLTPHLTVGEQNKLNKKVQDFYSLLLNPEESPVQLVLSVRELNVLIASADISKEKYRIASIEKDKLTVLASVSFFNGNRFNYLNCIAELLPVFEGGYLNFTLSSLKVREKLLPDKYIKYLKWQNLLHLVYTDGYNDSKERVSVREFLRRLRSIQFEKGRVVLSG